MPAALPVCDACRSPIAEVVQAVAIETALPCAAVLVIHAGGLATRAFDVPAALAAAGLAVYLLQGAGFQYHLIPFHGLAMMARALVLVQAPRPSLAVVVAASVSGLLAAGALKRGFYRNVLVDKTLTALEGSPQAGSVIVLTSHSWAGPGLAKRLGSDRASRYSSNWLVPGAVNQLATTDCAKEAVLCDSLAALASRNRTENIADIVLHRPDLLIVDRNSGYFARSGFDWLAFIGGAPRWVAAFADYRPFAETRRFQSFRRDG